MNYKDPKDMTASELLRSIAGRCRTEGLGLTGEVELLRRTFGAERNKYHCEIDMVNALIAIADEIDAELILVRAAELRELAAIWAVTNGWPDFRDGEDFGEWLDRCALKRPRYEDGEPVQMGDEIAIGGGSIDVNEAVMLLDGSGYRLLHGKDVSTSAIEDRVKRPAPEVLGADGLPLNEDDTVYGTGREQHRYTVQVPYSINDGVGERFCVQCYDHDEGNITWCDPSMLTHTPPDTQERIDEDKHKIASAYWRCESEFCSNCPSKIDGMSPREYYDVCICDVAQGMDIARRQRELDKRKGGEE